MVEQDILPSKGEGLPKNLKKMSLDIYERDLVKLIETRQQQNIEKISGHRRKNDNCLTESFSVLILEDYASFLRSMNISSIMDLQKYSNSCLSR